MLEALLLVGSGGAFGGDDCTCGPALIVTGEALVDVVVGEAIAYAELVVVDDGVGAVEDGLGAAVVFVEGDDSEVVGVAVVEVNHGIEAGPLELVDGLIVVAYDENVGVFPVVGEVADDAVLAAVGVLKLVDEEVAVALLVAEQQARVVMEGAQYPTDHVAVVVAALGPEGLLVLGEEGYAAGELGHTLTLFVDLAGHGVAGLLVAVLLFVGKVGVGVEPVDVGGDALLELVFGPVFGLHLGEEILQVVFVVVGLVVAKAEGVGLGQAVHQLADDTDAFQLGEGLQSGAAEVVQVVLDDVAAEAVEGVDTDPVRLRADEAQQPLPHRLHASIGEGETENVVGTGIGLEQDIADAGGQ